MRFLSRELGLLQTLVLFAGCADTTVAYVHMSSHGRCAHMVYMRGLSALLIMVLTPDAELCDIAVENDNI